MKSEKSVAEIEIKEEINHMDDLISQQNVKIEDAEVLVAKAIKIWAKCEELRKSRDNWRNKYEQKK